MSYLAGILCDVRHNRRKVYLSADSVHKKLAGATTVLLPRISPSELFLRKIPGMVLFRPAIAAAGVAGLFDLHFDQFGEAGLQPLPDPMCKIFAGRIL